MYILQFDILQLVIAKDFTETIWHLILILRCSCQDTFKNTRFINLCIKSKRQKMICALLIVIWHLRNYTIRKEKT